MIYTLLISIIISIFFISLGIIIGSLVSEKATGGVSSIIVQLVCFTSGMYFSKELIGKTFQIICEILPFESSLNIIKAVFNGNTISLNNVIVFLLYFVVTLILAIIIFKKNMTSDNK